MGKQIEKTVVPPREERLEQIGDPKTPRMGGLTPKTIEVPEVDDLIEKMKKVTKPAEDLREFWTLAEPFKFVTFDMEQDVLGKPINGHCHVNCKCPPCQSGYCSGCTVEAMRDDEDRTAVRAAVAEYRGVVLQ